MHILILPSAFPNDYNVYAGIFYQQMSISLHESGIQTGVIAPDVRPFKEVFSLAQWRQFGQFNAYALKEKLPVLRKTAINILPRFKYFNQWIAARYTLELFEKYIAKHGKPDLVHAHAGMWGGWEALKIKEKYDIPYVITEHSSAFLKQTLSRNDLNIHRKIYEKAEKIMAVSNALKVAIQSKFDFDIEVVPNFIDTSLYSLRIANKIPKKIFAVGNLLKTKGFDILIQAFAKCLAVHPEMKLTIAGTGPEKDALIALANSLNLKEKVFFTGALSPEDVSIAMQKSDIFVSASLFETFGVSIIEAMACGIPVVATKCGGPEEIVQNETGILCEKNDVEGLYNAILYVYEHFEKYEVQKIRQVVENRFSKHSIIERLKNIYLTHGDGAKKNQ